MLLWFSINMRIMILGKKLHLLIIIKLRCFVVMSLEKRFYDVLRMVDITEAQPNILLQFSGCDILTKRRSRSVLPGALWHIFHPSDTPKIRDLLNKVDFYWKWKVKVNNYHLLIIIDEFVWLIRACKTDQMRLIKFNRKLGYSRGHPKPGDEWTNSRDG